jgi:hypothetical protein
VRASLSDVIIAGEEFTTGFALKFALTLLGVKIDVDCAVDLIFIKAKVSVSAFKFAGMRLGGLGCDMNPKSSDDSACLWIELGVLPTRAKFQFTGVFSVFGFF